MHPSIYSNKSLLLLIVWISIVTAQGYYENKKITECVAYGIPKEDALLLTVNSNKSTEMRLSSGSGSGVAVICYGADCVPSFTGSNLDFW